MTLHQTTMAGWPMVPIVSLARTAASAYWMMGSSTPDLLITHQEMPGMDGFSVLRALRQIHNLFHTTIVVMTDRKETEVNQRGSIPDGIQVFSKPIPFDRLLSIAATIVDSWYQMKMPEHLH